MGQLGAASELPFGLSSIPVSVLLGVLRACGDRLHEGIYIVDADDRLQYANPAAQRMLGVQRESQVLGRGAGPLWRRVSDDFDVRRYPLHDEQGEVVAALGVAQRRRGRPVPRPIRTGPLPAGDGGFAVVDPATLDLDASVLGCIAVRLIGEPGVTDGVLRDLSHLVARVTRPEDMVLRIDADTLAVFAFVDTLAGLKSIAERITARGRREIAEEFRVGIALGGPADTAASLAEAARASEYTCKPRMRGRVAARRSGVGA